MSALFLIVFKIEIKVMIWEEEEEEVVAIFLTKRTTICYNFNDMICFGSLVILDMSYGFMEESMQLLRECWGNERCFSKTSTEVQERSKHVYRLHLFL